MVGFKIEDVQREKYLDSGLMDSRLSIENRGSFCYHLATSIWAKVEEWKELTWKDYPQRVMDWYKRECELEVDRPCDGQGEC